MLIRRMPPERDEATRRHVPVTQDAIDVGGRRDGSRIRTPGRSLAPIPTVDETPDIWRNCRSGRMTEPHLEC
jgi:hypothetical protein